MRVLNLYAGIGGNRKLWENVEVTAVESDPEIAEIYQHYFPDDEVIVGDAHQYLLENYRDYDFIWSSPPCPTHSEIRVYGAKRGQYPPMYPDFKLWQEITFLKHYSYDTHWVVENVKIYYDPIVQPTFKLDRHWFWASFVVPHIKYSKKEIGHVDLNGGKSLFGFDLKQFKIKNRKDQILRNMVRPEVGLHILEVARGGMPKGKQQTLF